MAEKPKPKTLRKPKAPSVAPPKIVPGKETARSIGIDTAFIDGLAAGLVDEADLPPPPPVAPKTPEAPKKSEAPAKTLVGHNAPARKAPARKPPPPRGLSETSGPLFRVQEVAKQDDDDPLAALLGDAPAEQQSSATPTFVPPKPRDDLLARLAKEDDEDGSVMLKAPVAPKPKSESSGLTAARSERSGDMPLPKGTDAPVFDPKPKEEAKAIEKPKAPPPPEKPKAEKKIEAPKPAPAPAPVPAEGSPLAKVHPGLWFLLAAAVFGLFVPILAGGSGGEATAPSKTDAQRRVTGTAESKKALDREAPVEDAEEPDAEEEVPAAVDAEEEEVVELDEEEAAVAGEGKDERKSDGDGKDQKSASQLLTDAKAAYSQGRNGDAYRLAGASHRQRASEDALIVRAKAACRMGNESAAKKSFEELPMGDARREVRPVCRDKGIRLGL